MTILRYNNNEMSRESLAPTLSKGTFPAFSYLLTVLYILNYMSIG